MKGKVSNVGTEVSDSGRFAVSITVTMKKGLTHKRAEQILKELNKEYNGKTVEIWLHENIL